MGDYKRRTIRQVKGLGWILGNGEVYESFLFTPEVETYFSSSNSFFDHGACGDFYLTNAFASPQRPILFSNGDIPKLKQLL